MVFLFGCTNYVADNKYPPHKISSLQSIKILFDFIVDEDVTVDDPRIKSIIYASRQKSYVVIAYTNVNGDKLANKIAEILTKHNVVVKKPMLIEVANKPSLNKYIVVYISYR